MAKLDVPYLVKKPGKGGVPRYFWQPAKALRELGWPPQRIPDNYAGIADPNALEAAAIAKARALNEDLAAWREGRPSALLPAPRAPIAGIVAGSLGHVIASYKRSRFFLERRESTRRSYLQSLALLEAWGADVPVRAISPKSIQEFYDRLRGRTLATANAAVRTLRIVLEHARRENLIAINPAVKPGLIGLAPSGLIWPPAAIALFVRHADAAGWYSIGTAVMINEWLGQRQGDVLKLHRGILRHGELVLRQSKTGAGVKLPLGMIEPLMRRVEEELGRQDARKVTSTRLIVHDATGLDWNEHTFRHEFAAIRAACALECPSFAVDYLVRSADEEGELAVAMTDLQFKHLRHTAVVRLAEAGCETPLISAVTGHTLLSIEHILERYLVRTGAMARAAFGKRLAKEKADG